MAPRKSRRGRRAFPRPTTGTRVPKKAILIVCEGKCTEPDYFNYLRRKWKINPKLVDVQIIGADQCGNDPKSIVRYAKEQRDDRKKSKKLAFDSIWCVFDVEAPPHLSLPDAISQAADLKFNLALTNPAFEYWLLLHFNNTSRPLTPSGQAMKELCKHLPDYNKNLPDEMMEDISPLTSTAVKRARERFGSYSISDVKKTNPSTHVYKLVEELESQSIG